MIKVNRGDIFYADLDLGIGSEQQGIRPVLILQNDLGNKYSTTTIIAPITTKSYISNSQPTHVRVEVPGEKVSANSIILLEQIRTIDKSRLKGYVCNLEEKEMLKVEKAIKVSLGLK